MKKPKRKMIRLLQEEVIYYRQQAGKIDFRDATTDQLKMLFDFNRHEYETIKRIEKLRTEIG
ncbi:hypothetical protein [Liquorilactobacillus satsumensis]|uniref:hypothetical protein n=1 Tax=Liquorilactobacillus satsumensis TaxID=259059 RepID=UPI0039E75FB8